MKNLFQLTDEFNENMGVYTSESKDGYDLNDLCSVFYENALEAFENLSLAEYIEQNGFERVNVEIVYDF